MTAKLGARFGSIRSVKKLLGLVLAIVIVVSATLVLFPTKPTNAATVNGAKITRTSLNADLTAIAANSSFACYAALSYSKASGQTLLGINGATSRTFSTDFAAYWLSERIGGLAAEQYVAHHHLVVTAVDELTAAKDLAASITDVTNATSSATPVAECPANGAAVLASMPKSFVAQQVQIQAAHEAVLRQVSALSPAEAGKAYFVSHPEAFETICVSAIVGEPQDIVHAQQAMAAGTSFADAARQFSRSADASKGGTLGCFDPTSKSYASVQGFVGTLSTGKTGEPFAVGSQQNVYAILHVDRRVHATNYADFSALAEVLAQNVSQQVASNAIVGDLATATVTVNSAYGSWSTAKQQYRVLPPTTAKV